MIFNVAGFRHTTNIMSYLWWSNTDLGIIKRWSEAESFTIKVNHDYILLVQLIFAQNFEATPSLLKAT